MVFVYLLVLVAYFVLAYFYAKWFYEVAEKKGHHDKKYFWICLWLGIVGFLLVIALPDRGKIEETSNFVLPSKSSAIVEDRKKVCPSCGHKQASRNQVCTQCGEALY